MDYFLAKTIKVAYRQNMLNAKVVPDHQPNPRPPIQLLLLPLVSKSFLLISVNFWIFRYSTRFNNNFDGNNNINAGNNNGNHNGSHNGNNNGNNNNGNNNSGNNNNGNNNNGNNISTNNNKDDTRY
jgi:hypothetical protein